MPQSRTIISPLNTSGAVMCADVNQTYTTGNLNVNVANFPTANGNVNVFDGSGNSIASTSHALNAYITNFPSSQTVSIGSGSIANTGFNVNNFTQGTKTMWNASTVTNTTNENSSIIILNTTPTRQITFFGNSSASAVLTVMFSNDGSTFYASQYNVTANGNFGFTVNSSAYYVQLQASGISSSSTITCFANYS